MGFNFYKTNILSGFFEEIFRTLLRVYFFSTFYLYKNKYQNRHPFFEICVYINIAKLRKGCDNEINDHHLGILNVVEYEEKYLLCLEFFYCSQGGYFYR